MSQLSTDQLNAIDAAGKAFDVDPALIASVYGKESSFGATVADPFRSFGLIYGPGEYNGYGYAATTDTFSDAAKTVAAFIASERAAYDQQQPKESFLQFFDSIYSPPQSNPNSFANLTALYKQLGGDPAGEAHYTASAGAQPSPAPAPSSNGSGAAQSAPPWWWILDHGYIFDPQGAIKAWQSGTTDAGLSSNAGDTSTAGGVTGTLKSLLLDFTIGAFFLALIAGGFAIVASSSAPAPSTIEKAAAA